jgi:hypothetical protein
LGFFYVLTEMPNQLPYLYDRVENGSLAPNSGVTDREDNVEFGAKLRSHRPRGQYGVWRQTPESPTERTIWSLAPNSGVTDQEDNVKFGAKLRSHRPTGPSPQICARGTWSIMTSIMVFLYMIIFPTTRDNKGIL